MVVDLNSKPHSLTHIANMSYDEDNQLSVREIVGDDGTGTIRKAKVDSNGAVYTTAASLPLPTGAATSAKQDTQTTLLQGIAGFTITGYDYIALTYVAAGNGAGEIETVVFRTGGSGGSIIATLTLAYNSSNEISSVTKV